MAAPTTSVLDNFNRANTVNTVPPSASWTRINGFSGDCQIDTNQLKGAAAGSSGGDFWNVATFGPDAESWMQLPVRGASTFVFVLYVRWDNTNKNGYRVVGTWSSPDSWQLQRVTAGATTNLGSAATNTIAAGGYAWLNVTGSVLTAYYSADGITWTSIVSYDTASDGTKYTAAGNIGLASNEVTGRMDNFAGGTVSPGGVFVPKILGYQVA